MKRNSVYIHPLQNQIVFPYHEYHISINSNQFDPRQYDNLIGFVSRMDSNYTGVDRIQGLSRYGTLMKIHRQSVSDFIVNEKVRIYKLNITGITFARFKILSLVKKESSFIANIQILSDDLSKENQAILLKKKTIERLKQQIIMYYECTLRLIEANLRKEKLQSEKSLNKILYMTMSQVDVPLSEKLMFLQENDHIKKVDMLIKIISAKSENLKGIRQMQEKVRQQIVPKPKIIGNNWNGVGTKNDEFEKYRKRMAEKDLPQHVREELQKQMQNIDNSPQTKSVTMKYIDTILQIPWNESTTDCKDLKKAEEVLNAQHTGMEKIKQRILQFLAVKFRNGNSRGNILCLHGPPGVGKTSIAKSIAQALGRKFSRISLGGVTDEAQIRGHRRTYVAALPGVIMRTIIKAKSNNPVILLDEIEKLGRSYRGDPANALLEVLDPSQNSSFIDHYVALPFDLSKVLFICTANNIEELSIPLLNRLETIALSGYTKEQKFQIALKNIIPEQLKQNGVVDLVNFDEEAVKEVIQYSDELGVRQMERDFGKICRKVALKGQKQRITKVRVIDILGKRRQKKLWGGVGIVKGMAWTVYGGKVLIVEAIKSIGTGKIQITGQLGDVMKESVRIALSWIKANFNSIMLETQRKQLININEGLEDLEKINIHIHFPEGAIKKDGPSAGVTITTCLVSLLTGLKVKQKLSMTGEISLSGQVLPVGGIKQKCIAAINKGIEEIIIPSQNQSDLDEIPELYKKKVKFYPVSHLKDVLRIALTPSKDYIFRGPKL